MKPEEHTQVPLVAEHTVLGSVQSELLLQWQGVTADTTHDSVAEGSPFPELQRNGGTLI